MYTDYHSKKNGFWFILISLGTLMLLGGLIGYYFAAPVGLLSVAAVICTAVGIIGCGGVLFSMVEIVHEWIKKTAPLTRAMLLRGYTLAMIAGFVGGGGMLALFLLTQEFSGASQVEYTATAVSAVGGLLVGLGALNIRRDSELVDDRDDEPTPDEGADEEQL